jgi:acyl carrier protein
MEVSAFVEEQVTEIKVRRFLEESFPLVKKIGSDSLLLGTGLLDSLGILEVVSFLEREFHIIVSDEELVPENFQTIKSIAAFVVQKA